MIKYVKKIFLLIIICVLGILCLACEEKNQKKLNATIQESSTQESSTQESSTQESSTQEVTTQESFYGNWIIEKYIPTNTISQAGNSSDKYIGQKLTFSEERVTFGENTCEQPYYKKQTISNEDMLIGYKVDFKTLGIDSGTLLQMIEIYEGKYHWTGGMGASYFVKDDKTLIIDAGGIFLEAKRIE